jgi:hypothetical protein
MRSIQIITISKTGYRYVMNSEKLSVLFTGCGMMTKKIKNSIAVSINILTSIIIFLIPTASDKELGTANIEIINSGYIAK